MADLAGSLIIGSDVVFDGSHDNFRAGFLVLAAAGAPARFTTYYLMRGRDIDCSPSLVYRTWVVINEPDPTGSQYSGAKCGASSLRNIVVAASWTL